MAYPHAPPMVLDEGTYTVYEEVRSTKVYTVHLDGTTDLPGLLEGYAELCDDWEGDNESEEVALVVKETAYKGLNADDADVGSPQVVWDRRYLRPTIYDHIQKEWDALEAMLERGVIGIKEYLHLLQELANA